jgi:hypothetical protein
VFTITCPRCDGGDANCKRCEGSGRAMLYQCPRKAITDDARVLMRAYRDYERGFLPAPGAMEDQAAGFSRWISLIDAERNSIEEERAALRRARGRGASLPTSEGD